MKRAWKRPAESRWFTYDFSDMLAGRTIQSFTSAVSSGRSDNTRQLTQVGAPILTDTAVQIQWSGGVDGETYLTTVTVKDTQNEDLPLNGEILNDEIGFTLPLAIASAYLTGENYVDRFGFEETVRLTDQDRQGVIDGARLQTAIDDATQIVDSYLGVRYSTPLAAPVPSVVAGIVAALTREKLHAQRPTQQVTAEADRARSQLKDISAGRMVLPVDAGGAVDVAPAGLASGGGVVEGNVFNSETLDRF